MLNAKFIGQKIAEARKKNHLSQATLAHQVSISPQAVGKWERGESMPDITTLHRLAQILGVDLNYFSDTFSQPNSQRDSAHLSVPVADKHDQQEPSRKFDWHWDMSSGNWSDADFSGLKNIKDKFSSSNLKLCTFLDTDLSGLTLAKNNIEQCDFSGADLRNSKFQSSNLSKNKFHKCSLIDTTITKCNIENCDFSDANVTGAEFIESNWGSNTVEDISWKLTKFLKSNISNTTFTGTMEDCHFESCSFYSVTFENVTLLNSFFKYNDRFKKVRFINCQVDHITLAFLKNNQANLEGIKLIS